LFELTTIGYELATPAALLSSLRSARVEIVVDVRALANSRRPGFAKSRLSESLASAGIDYLHLRGLGTPAEGRAAARAGRYDELHRIYSAHLEEPVALAELETLAGIIRSGRRVCLLCLEANPEHCHRSLVAAALEDLLPVRVIHLAAEGPEPN
jgi:uncharacterized protein (DUF488 family)